MSSLSMCDTPRHGVSHVWWHMPAILSLRRLRQEDEKIKVILGYIMPSSLKQEGKNGGHELAYSFHFISLYPRLLCHEILTELKGFSFPEALSRTFQCL